jgi:hypothetical protein
VRQSLSNWLVAGGVAFALAAGGFAYFVLPSLIVNDAVFNERSTAASVESERLKDRNEVRVSSIALLTLLGLVVGSVLTWRTVRLTREGQLTDRYAKAVEGLAGDERASQLGAIYALEGIARISHRDHWSIMELLVERLREQVGTWTPARNDVTARRSVSPEVDAITRALGRRHSRWDRRHLNLTGLDLRNVDFSDADLRRANLSGSNLSGAFFNAARLDGALFVGAFLRHAHLDGASMRKADLTDAALEHARLQKADFSGAKIRRAQFTSPVRGARGLPDSITGR